MSERDMPLIFTSATCGWAVRNYAALFEKGIPFTAIDVKHAPGDELNLFRERFPYAKTPALLHGEVAVSESLIINEYIEERFASPGLMPPDAASRAAARLWMYHCDFVLFPELRRAIELRDPEEKQEAARQLQGRLDQLDRLAARRPTFVENGQGERIGLVDCCYHVWFGSLEVAADWLAPVEIRLPNWMREWAAALAGTTSIQRADALVKTLRVHAGTCWSFEVS